MRLLLAGAFALLLCCAARADTVVLKGGMKLEGTIVSETEAAVVLQLRTGGKTTLQKERIEAIERSSPSTPTPDDAEPPPKEEPPPTAPLPALGRGKEIEPGIVFHDVRYKGIQLWIYRPKGARRPPLVVMAPPGSQNVRGIDLVPGNQPEHLNFAQAGFAVIAFSLPGPIPERPTNAQFVAAVKTYLDAGGGMQAGKDALDYGFAKLKVNTDRVYAVGHSSAGAVALQLTAIDPRIKGCLTFAPVTQFLKQLTPAWLASVEKAGAEGLMEYARRTSPDVLRSRIRVPVLVIHAQDDKQVPFADTVAFVKALKQKNPDANLAALSEGGHYAQLIQLGGPRGIAWLKELGR